MILHYELSSREQFEIQKGAHHFDSLILLLSGEFEYVFENERRVIAPYEPLFFPKNGRFEKRTLCPIEYILVRFSCPMEIQSPWLAWREEDRARIQSSILYLQAAVSQGAPIERIEHFVRDILMVTEPDRAAEDQALTSLAGYMRSRCDQPLSLEQLARMAGYSKQTLIKKFRTRYRQTPIEYITQARIERAKRLLTQTDAPIGQIAERCGFANPYYFSNTFKHHTDLSPSSYRKLSKL